MIYISSSCKHRDQSLCDFIEQMLSEGISSIELSGSGKHVEDIEQRLLAYKQSRGCSFCVHNYFPVPRRPFVLNIAATDGAILAASLELAENAIRLAAKLGSGLYSVHAGYTKQLDPPTDGQHFVIPAQPKTSRQAALGVLAESVARLCRLGRSLGVAVALENLFPPGADDNFSLLCTADDIDQAFDEFGEHDNLGLLLDVGHARISANWLGFDATEFLGAVVGRHHRRVLGVHVSGNDATGDQHLLPDLKQTAEMLNHYELKNVPVAIEARNSDISETIEFHRELSRLIGSD